jgi:hypothetical protein
VSWAASLRSSCAPSGSPRWRFAPKPALAVRSAVSATSASCVVLCSAGDPALLQLRRRQPRPGSNSHAGKLIASETTPSAAVPSAPEQARALESARAAAVAVVVARCARAAQAAPAVLAWAQGATLAQAQGAQPVAPAPQAAPTRPPHHCRCSRRPDSPLVPASPRAVQTCAPARAQAEPGVRLRG